VLDRQILQYVPSKLMRAYRASHGDGDGDGDGVLRAKVSPSGQA